MEKIRITVVDAGELSTGQIMALVIEHYSKHGQEITEDHIELISAEQARQFEKVQLFATMTKLEYQPPLKKEIRKDRKSDRYRSKFHNKKI